MNQRKGDSEERRRRRVNQAVHNFNRRAGHLLDNLLDLKLRLTATRERFKQHGYEADARECERLLQEIRALDPGFEEAS